MEAVHFASSGLRKYNIHAERKAIEKNSWRARRKECSCRTEVLIEYESSETFAIFL